MPREKVKQYPIVISNHSLKFRKSLSNFAKNMGYGTYSVYVRKLINADMDKHDPKFRQNLDDDGC